MEVTKQINPPQTDFCDDSQLFSIDLCDNARSFLTLFSIGGGGGRLWPTCRYFLCCVKAVCSKKVKLSDFQCLRKGQLRMELLFTLDPIVKRCSLFI